MLIAGITENLSDLEVVFFIYQTSNVNKQQRQQTFKTEKMTESINEFISIFEILDINFHVSRVSNALCGVYE